MIQHSNLAMTAVPAAIAGILVMSAGCGGATEGDPSDGERPDSAILIAERFTTPDGRVMYMGAFPGMPTQNVDITQLIELGEGDVFACAGHAFHFDSEALSITKYIVANDLTLVKDLTVQVGQEGITGWTGAQVCASATSAFIFEGAGGRAVEWNPTTMVIVNAFDVPKPTVAEGLEIQFFEPFIAGNLIYFPVEATNWETLVTANAIVATFDLADKSLTYTYDTRCGGGLSGHVASDGTFYRYQGYQDFFQEYSTETLPPDCVLRINPGQKQFDTSYMRELGPTNNMWAIGDRSAVIMQIDPAQPVPSQENQDDWWSLPIVPTMVDLETGAKSPYAGLSSEPPMNARKLVLDGQSYFQLNTFDSEGRVANTALKRLTPQGAEEMFTLEGGDFLTLERLW